MKYTSRFKPLKMIFTIILAVFVAISNFVYAPMQYIHATSKTNLTVSGFNKIENQAFVYKIGENDVGTLKIESLNAPKEQTGKEYIFKSIDTKTYTVTITTNEGYTFKNLKVNKVVHPVEEFTISDKNTYTYSLSITGSMENVELIPEFKKNLSQASNRKIIVGTTTCIDETSSNPLTHYAGSNYTIIPSSNDGEYILNITDGATIENISAEGAVDLIIKNQGSGTIESKQGFSITGVQDLKTVEQTQNASRNLILKGGLKISDKITLNSNVDIGTSNSTPSHGIEGCKSLNVEYANLTIYTKENVVSLENIAEGILVGSKGKIKINNTKKNAFNNIGGKIYIINGGEIEFNNPGESSPSIKILSKWIDWQNKIWNSDSPASENEQEIDWNQATNTQNHYKCEKSSNANSAGDYTWKVSSTDSPMYTLIYGKGKNGETNETVNGNVKFISGPGQCISESNSEKYGEYKFPARSSITVKLLPQYGFQLNKNAVQSINTTPQTDKGTYTFIMPEQNIYLSELFVSSSDQTVNNAEGILSSKISPYSNLANGNLKLTISAVAEPSNASSFQNAAKNYEISKYFNIALNELILKNGDSNQAWESELSELSGPVGITLGLSDALKGKKRYCVLREHNGEITNLTSAYNPESNEIEFSSDKFSTYAIGYSNLVRSLSTQVNLDNEILNIIIEDPNNALNDQAELVVTLVKEGSERYNELKNNLDDTHKIERIMFFDIVIYKDSTHTEAYSKLDSKVNVLFQIPKGWDKEDLKAVLVAEEIDATFDEKELVNKNDIEYLSFWTDHFSPYAFLDELSDEDLKELEELSNQMEEPLPAQDDLANFLTGDSSRTLILIAVTAIVVSLAVLIILKKKKNK